MSQDEVYRQLAKRLDETPNGFPSTESGVELRLLAKIFEPQEAELASAMRLAFEPASAIAERAAVETGAARRLLKTMVRKGQIRVNKGEGKLVFALMPFVVGFYEEQLPRIDAEFAQLFEEYFEEALSTEMADTRPAIHRVVPVEESIALEVEVHPYERATALVEGAKAWGVRECICRIQQRLVGKGCERLVSSCLSFAPIPGFFDGNAETKAISKEEALSLLREAVEAGLVHTTGNYQDGVSYICNCCSCCCGVLRSIARHPTPNTVVRSDFRAVVDADECISCVDCIARCQFSALSLADGAVCIVDETRCIGCGLCTTVCPTDAITLQRRSDVAELPPSDRGAWMAERARERGLAVSGD
ncbi:MAG: 4Fe-4S ferredoxin [Anaerolineales bacterium]|nr:MAG: 4Fe-4S ferredoxin [Anaerolineales bacterium]